MLFSTLVELESQKCLSVCSVVFGQTTEACFHIVYSSYPPLVKCFGSKYLDSPHPLPARPKNDQK